jgi:hypothetical protein
MGAEQNLKEQNLIKDEKQDMHAWKGGWWWRTRPTDWQRREAKGFFFWLFFFWYLDYVQPTHHAYPV